MLWAMATKTVETRPHSAISDLWLHSHVLRTTLNNSTFNDRLLPRWYFIRVTYTARAIYGCSLGSKSANMETSVVSSWNVGLKSPVTLSTIVCQGASKWPMLTLHTHKVGVILFHDRNESSNTDSALRCPIARAIAYSEPSCCSDGLQTGKSSNDVEERRIPTGLDYVRRTVLVEVRGLIPISVTSLMYFSSLGSS